MQIQINCELVRHSPRERVRGSSKIDNRAGLRSTVFPPFSLSKSESKAKTFTTTAQLKNTNLSRSWRRPHSLACTSPFSADKIKETDPYRIKLLWQEVMAPKTPSYARPTKASQHRDQALLNTPRSSEDTGVNETPASAFSTTISKTGTGGTQSAKMATVRDVDFEVTQLIPRGVEIHREWNLQMGIVAGAHAYFGSDTPSNQAQSREFYLSVVQEALAGRAERNIDDSIFLSMDASFVMSVQRAYRRMGEEEVSEPEFKAYACQNLFIRQYAVLTEEVERQLCAVRLVEISLKPRESTHLRMWRAPPLLSSDQPPSKFFGFDIYSDCQFWLSDKILNADYRRYARRIVHCKSWGTFCPYLSIEFKATADDRLVVVNQVAAAGLISLFNRYQLKLDAYPQPAPEQFNLVRHYGLTMEKELWAVWLFEPKIAKVNGAWAGCTMRVLGAGSLIKGEVVELLEWINEIHRWGLCEYALGCEEDIKQILSRGSTNLRISAIGS